MLYAKNPNSWNGHTYVLRFEYKYASGINIYKEKKIDIKGGMTEI